MLPLWELVLVVQSSSQVFGPNRDGQRGHSNLNPRTLVSAVGDLCNEDADCDAQKTLLALMRRELGPVNFTKQHHSVAIAASLKSDKAVKASSLDTVSKQQADQHTQNTKDTHNTIGAASFKGDPPSNASLEILCIVAVISLFAAYIQSVRRNISALDPVAGRAVISAYVSDVLLDLEYSIIMPTVYHLALQFGSDAAFSGFVIGANQSFNIVGVLLSFACGLGSVSYRVIFFSCMACFPFLSLMYVSSVFGESNQLSCFLLLASRSIQGLIRGVLECRVYRMFADTVPKHELRSISMGWVLSIALGTGLGPIASSLCLNYIAPLFPNDLRYVVPTLVVSVVHALALPVYHFIVPTSASLAETANMIHEQNKGDTARRETRMGPLRAGALYLLICSCVTLSLLLGALESATSMILQIQYQWNNSSTGFVVGLCMLCYIPLHFALDMATSPRDQPVLLRAGLIISFLMAFFLLPEFCAFVHDHIPFADTVSSSWGCALFIIVSDAIVWPLVQMCLGMVTGMALEWTDPDAEDSTSQMITIAVTITYFVSSPLSRVLIEKQGVHSYAMLQIGLCTAAITLVEVAKMFRPRSVLPPPPRSSTLGRLSLTNATSSSSEGGPPVHL
eukprot:gnl/MRDRNA2_/MRDRNA2_122014_c0_seq1.p1 gnl/MRDRNA2_/MRDRNA2_122014_c0~~gnl/MRDRNA2_/MRDRNA2_122014_c0_seq1.p1  ORF type:complete len:621 (+),score=61.00 gnl/MRDRNA2_/MRDRNA2_122014_c0_seq1:58-1920(+)